MNQDAPICIVWFTSSTRRDRARHRSHLAAAVLWSNDRRAGHRFLRRNHARMRLRSTAMTAPIRSRCSAPCGRRRSLLLRRRKHRLKQRRVRHASQAFARSHIIPHAVHHLIGVCRRQALARGEQCAHGFFIGIQRLRVPIQRRKASPEAVQTAGEVGQEGGRAGVGEGAAASSTSVSRRASAPICAASARSSRSTTGMSVASATTRLASETL